MKTLLFTKNRAVFEIMSRNMVEPDFSSNIIMLTKLRDMKWSMYVEDVEKKNHF